MSGGQQPIPTGSNWTGLHSLPSGVRNNEATTIHFNEVMLEVSTLAVFT